MNHSHASSWPDARESYGAMQTLVSSCDSSTSCGRREAGMPDIPEPSLGVPHISAASSFVT